METKKISSTALLYHYNETKSFWTWNYLPFVFIYIKYEKIQKGIGIF